MSVSTIASARPRIPMPLSDLVTSYEASDISRAVIQGIAISFFIESDIAEAFPQSLR